MNEIIFIYKKKVCRTTRNYDPILLLLEFGKSDLQQIDEL